MSVQRINSFGEELLDFGYRFMLIEASLGNANKPHSFFQVLKSFLETIASCDPNRFHFEIARFTLQRFDKESEQATDLLARELVKACRTLDTQLKMPANLARLIQHEPNTSAQLGNSFPTITELPHTTAAFERQFFTKDGLSIWDSCYVELLCSLGSAGKEQATIQKKNIQESTAKWDRHFWFTKRMTQGENHFFHSPAFLALAAMLWKDIVEKQITVTSKRNIISLASSIKFCHLPCLQELNRRQNVESVQIRRNPC